MHDCALFEKVGVEGKESNDQSDCTEYKASWIGSQSLGE